MTPLQALRSATIAPATMLGVNDETGSLLPGKFTDIVAVARGPVADISAFDDIILVMKAGETSRIDLPNQGRPGSD